MSFSSEQKQHIINEQIKNNCCRKAILCGILSSGASVTENYVYFSLEKDEYVEFAKKLISEFYGREVKPVKNKNGGRRRTVYFESKSASAYLNKISDCEHLFADKCPSCFSCYLKGVFLSCGNFSDPKKQYSVDFSPASNAELIFELMQQSGLSPKLSLRNQRKIIYFKKASYIEDFCGFCGLTNALFAVTNSEIEGEILNNTNRIVNCETNNIEKSVKASAKQIEVIRALINNNLLSNLPDELEYTARLRIQNESLSLSQLAKKFTPPISKSGLSHRLNKIIEIAEILLTGRFDA